jgi:hypothetical protein
MLMSDGNLGHGRQKWHIAHTHTHTHIYICVCVCVVTGVAAWKGIARGGGSCAATSGGRFQGAEN